MPRRRVLLATDQIYHVFNRGVANAPIFLAPREYQRFFDMISYYRFAHASLSYSHFKNLAKEVKVKYLQRLKQSSPLLLEILAFCLMPNHFHLLIKQVRNQGISTCIRKVQNGFAKYFNTRHKRSGPLFEPMFKAVLVENEEQLLHVSRYIHLNPTTSFLTTKVNLLNYRWSSLPNYLQSKKSSLVETELILSLAGGVKKYKKFVFNQIDYQRQLKRIQHLTFENSFIPEV